MLNPVGDINDLLHKALVPYYDKKNRDYPTIKTALWHLANGLNVNVGMCRAAQEGHIELVKFFIQKGANWWDYGM